MIDKVKYLILCCFFMIMGCGFKPAEIVRPYFKTCQLICSDEFGEFALQFKRRLIQSSVIISPNASLVIKINTKFKSNTYNNESSVLARLWNTCYEAEVILQKNELKKQLPLFKVERSFYLQPNELFEGSEQLSIVKQEMAEQLAEQIWKAIIVPFHDN